MPKSVDLVIMLFRKVEFLTKFHLNFDLNVIEYCYFEERIGNVLRFFTCHRYLGLSLCM